MELPNKKEIKEKRKEIKKRIVALIKEDNLSLAWDDIVNEIKTEETGQELNNLIESVVGETENLKEANEKTQLISDAWNYFPHDSLEGKSPIEKIIESRSEG